MPGKYMVRRRFYVPIKEQERYYAGSPKNVSNYFFDSDYEEDDPRQVEETSGN